MKASESLVVGQLYSREDLKKRFGIADATLNTGVFRPKGYESIWLFVTDRKTADRTQYLDRLDGDILHWDGQQAGRTDRLIVEHESHDVELLLFYRKMKYEHPGAAFRYEGRFAYVSHSGSRPSHFVLHRAPDIYDIVDNDLASIKEEEGTYVEGRSGRRYINHYERDRRLRSAAIRIHGTICMACGFDFEEFYGPRGRGYIEVHHLKPVSTLAEPTSIDPKLDMAVLCSNCHRVVHRHADDVLSLDDLRATIRDKRSRG